MGLVTVKSSGGDYTSLNSALSGESGDLVTAADALTVECYAMQDTYATTGTGYTTSSTYDITITVPTAERHSGSWDTSAYRMVYTTGSANGGGCLWLTEGNVTVVGVQFDIQIGVAYRSCILTDNGQTDPVLIDKCILTSGNTGYSTYLFLVGLATGTYGAATIRNSVIYNSPNDGSWVRNSTAAVNYYNCTIYGNTDDGIDRNNGTVTVTNCAVFGNTGSDFEGTVTATYCASDDLGTGTGNVQPSDWSTVFTDYTNYDFSLLSTDTDLIDSGTTISGFSDDIAGETRGSTWDIGAFEYVAGVTDLSITASDAINVSELVSLFIDLGVISVNDGLSLSEYVDAALEGLSLSITAFDIVSLAENIALNLPLGNININDPITLIENISRNLPLGDISESDTVAISEIITRDLSLGDISVADLVSLSEVIGRNISLGTISVYDGISVIEYINEALEGLSLTITVNDILSISENTEHNFPLGSISVSENIASSEVIGRGIPLGLIDKADNLTLSEFTTLLSELLVTAYDSVTINEFINVLKELEAGQVNRNEQLTINEYVSILKDIGSDISQSIEISEFINALLILSIEKSEQLTIAEDTTTEINITFSLYDSIAILESVQTQLGVGLVSVSDLISLTEYVTAFVSGDLNPSRYESLQISEHVSVSVNLATGDLTCTFTIKKASAAFVIKKASITFTT